DSDLSALRDTAAYRQLLKERVLGAEADALCAAGLEWQQKAESIDSADTARVFFQRAIDCYSRATQIRADYHRAHGMWSICLLHLARLDPVPGERKIHLAAARERFAVATKCKD